MKDTRALVQWLRTGRYRLGAESHMQDSMEEHLKGFGLPFLREFTLAAGSRVDFYVPALGAAIEAKVRCPKRVIWRQICRYAAQPNVSSVILVTATAMGIPREAHGKPLFYVSAGRGLL